MFIRAKYVLQFSRRNDLKNTVIDQAIENRRTVWTFMFEAAGRKVACENSRPNAPNPSGVSRLFSQARRKAEGSISYNYRFHIVTRFKSRLQITDVIFSQCLP